MAAAPRRRVVLASRSPQRRELLSRLTLDFSVRVSDAPELEHGDPPAVALENALRKARAVHAHELDALVIGCDTLVALDGRIYGKPGDATAARTTIAALAGRTHEVISGLAVLVDEQERTAVARTAVSFRALDERELDWYVSTGEWQERSGGYAIQREGAQIVERIEGEIDNVVGLPLQALRELAPEIASEP